MSGQKIISQHIKDTYEEGSPIYQAYQSFESYVRANGSVTEFNLCLCLQRFVERNHPSQKIRARLLAQWAHDAVASIHSYKYVWAFAAMYDIGPRALQEAFKAVWVLADNNHNLSPQDVDKLKAVVITSWQQWFESRKYIKGTKAHYLHLALEGAAGPSEKKLRVVLAVLDWAWNKNINWRAVCIVLDEYKPPGATLESMISHMVEQIEMYRDSGVPHDYRHPLNPKADHRKSTESTTNQTGANEMGYEAKCDNNHATPELELRVFLDGQDLTNISDDYIIGKIAEFKAKVKSLEELGVQSTTVKAKIDKYNEVIADLVKFMDTRNAK